MSQNNLPVNMHKNVGKKWDRLEQRKSGTAGNLASKSGTVPTKVGRLETMTRTCVRNF